jgi:hypothetical protein
MLEGELMARDRRSREDLLAYRRQRLRALVLHAVTHSPYSREVLGADAEERPLAELQAVIAAVTSTGAVAPAVDVEPVPALQREPGGKLRVVRSV